MSRKPWGECPVGTRAFHFDGGHWVRVEGGWKWINGAIFREPTREASLVVEPDGTTWEVG